MKGSTGVTTNAEEAWTQRQGVCQDLAHLAIGALRSCGIPARYVSGYLHPRSTADLGETVAGQSHAWLEWWDGEWRSWDPTNHKPAGDFHVTVARGRDYRDVPPLKGILSGGGGSALSVTVEITLAGRDPRAHQGLRVPWMAHVVLLEAGAGGIVQVASTMSAAAQS